jgi:hypothetical protein
MQAKKAAQAAMLAHGHRRAPLGLLASRVWQSA